MIELRSLVKSVQVAAQSAVEAISAENLKVFDTYFERVVEEGTIEKNLTARPEEGATPIPSMVAAFTASDGLRYKPRTIVLQYPVETKDGPKIHDVHVPLLTLVPVTMPQVSELRFSTDLELTLDEEAPDNVRVSFPKKTKPKGFLKQQEDDGEPSKANLEIVINASNATDGLQKIIEGYEKALRAQIPN